MATAHYKLSTTYWCIYLINSGDGAPVEFGWSESDLFAYANFLPHHNRARHCIDHLVVKADGDPILFDLCSANDENLRTLFHNKLNNGSSIEGEVQIKFVCDTGEEGLLVVKEGKLQLESDFRGDWTDVQMSLKLNSTGIIKELFSQPN